jgi:hypothetical protein
MTWMWEFCILLFLACSYILYSMCPLCCPWPLCIHGNSCLLGSTTGNQTMAEQTWFWSLSLWETYLNICLLLLANQSGDSIYSIWLVSLFLEWGSLSDLDLHFSSDWMTDNVQVLCWTSMSVTLFMTVFDYYPYGSRNHIDTSQLNHIQMLLDCCGYSLVCEIWYAN